MPDDPRIERLLEELLDTNGTPEEVCRDTPELLPQVRAGLRQLRLVEDEVSALFPPSDPADDASPSPPSTDLPQIPGYEVQGLLGYGGMGVVYKAWHRRLNRPVALKMLLAGPYARPAELERFLREAQAVAGLRHPNVVQVYDAGDLDGRPYFTMELVDGGSLAQKVAGGPQPVREAAAVLAAVADAVHAAHQSGVVHRDLKPANILLTAADIPKVTDFGLARRLEGDAGLTLSGAPMGTPGYMAPEQVRGERGAVGLETDVYALGAILYELLTGRPPFHAETAAATLHKVLEEEPVPPARLNPGVPRDLQTICLKCLNKEPQRRYDSAAALAEDLRRFERGEPIAARPAGVAESLRKWVRRRPAVAALLVAVTLIVASGATGAWLLYQQRVNARAHRAQTDSEVRGILERTRGPLDDGWQAADLAKVTQARFEADRAADVARTGGASPAVQHEAEAFREYAAGRLERTEKDRALLDALQDVSGLQDVSAPHEALSYVGKAGRSLVQPEFGANVQYAAAFRRWGLDVDGTPEAEVVARLGAEPGPVVQELVAGLDRWMRERRRQNLPESQWQRLFRVANRLDGDERRRRLRALIAGAIPLSVDGAAGLVAVGAPWPALLWELRLENGRRPLLELRKEIDPRTEPALTVALLAEACADVGDTAGAEQMLRQAITERPDQVVLLGRLGKLLEEQGPSRIVEAIGYYRAARSVRPSLGLALSNALRAAGKAAEAEEVLLQMVRRQTPDANLAVHFYLGEALVHQHKYDEAEAAYREVIRLRPDWGPAYSLLGAVFYYRHKYDEAEAACRKAIDLRPNDAGAYRNLGAVLNSQGSYGKAEAACRKAIALSPDDAAANNNLGNALFHQRRYGEAEAHYRRAIALQPDVAKAYSNLGGALYKQGKHGEAEAACRKALALQPDDAEVYSNLGAALNGQRKYGEAEATYRRAIALQPDFGPAWCNLGRALMNQARFEEAAVALKKGIDLLPATDLAREQVRKSLGQCQRLVALDAKLPAILRGTEEPAGAAKQLDIARLCTLRKYYAAAARFSRDAFAADPKLAEDIPAGTRYDAACAAALAGCGHGTDTGLLNDQERARWRRQALDWLRLDLTWCDRALEQSKAQASAVVRQKMQHWLTDADLSGIRDGDALARLPEDERREWERLWSDVDALLRRVSQDK